MLLVAADGTASRTGTPLVLGLLPVEASRQDTAASTDAVSEGKAHAGAGRLRLGDTVFKTTLRLAARDQKVALTKTERARPPTSDRTKQERPRLTERHECNHRIHDLGRDPVFMPGDTVGAVAVEVDAHRVEADVIAGGEGVASFLHPRARETSRLVDPLPSGQARLVHVPVVHPPAPLAPGDAAEQFVEGPVGARHPPWAVVHPGIVVELGTAEAAKRPVDDGALVGPQ